MNDNINYIKQFIADNGLIWYKDNHSELFQLQISSSDNRITSCKYMIDGGYNLREELTGRLAEFELLQLLRGDYTVRKCGGKNK